MSVKLKRIVLSVFAFVSGAAFHGAVTQFLTVSQRESDPPWKIERGDMTSAFPARTNASARLSGLDTLVMVAGHAVYTGSNYGDGHAARDSSWFIMDFQRGQVGTFVAHIRKGVDLTAADATAMLMFSGGQTREEAGPNSEAGSYWRVAEAQRWWHHKHTVRWRTFTEDFARDSYENLLFSICRFRQITGRYPALVRVVGFEFKRRRFVDLHRAAIRYDVSRFEYIGIDPPGADERKQHQLAAAEMRASVLPFRADPYGCHVPLLTKRLGRNPFARAVPYPSGCSELRPLLSWCSFELIRRSALPWGAWPRLRRSAKQKTHGQVNPDTSNRTESIRTSS